ncbi:MAG: hypothetical protein ACI9MR_002324 [Myxococcota bacterium]
MCGVVALAQMLSGCPEAQLVAELRPVHVLERYRDALIDGRLAEAFSYIHPEAREGMDLDGFELLYARHRDALVAQAEGLVSVGQASEPVVHAWVDTDKGRVELVRTLEGWRLMEPVGKATPR